MILPFLILILLVGCSNESPPGESKSPTIEVKESTITPIKTEPVQATLKEHPLVASTSENKINPTPKPVIQPKYKRVCRSVKIKGKLTTQCKTIRIHKKYPGTRVPKHKK